MLLFFSFLLSAFQFQESSKAVVYTVRRFHESWEWGRGESGVVYTVRKFEGSCAVSIWRGLYGQSLRKVAQFESGVFYMVRV